MEGVMSGTTNFDVWTPPRQLFTKIPAHFSTSISETRFMEAMVFFCSSR